MKLFRGKYRRIAAYFMMGSACLFWGGMMSPAHAKTLEKHTETASAIGFQPKKNSHTIWNEDSTVHVSGKGNRGVNTYPYNVTGVYLLYGSKLTVNGNLNVLLENSDPAVRGSNGGPDVAHYYMSGVYAGYGGQQRSGFYGTTTAKINGRVNLDVTGTGLQANKDGLIIARGGKIVTKSLSSSDQYAIVAEDGAVYLNTGDDGEHPGQEKTEIYGNLGVINKNYGLRGNPGTTPTKISLALTTPGSSLTGGVLNEFAENGSNPLDSGVTMYLQNGALWQNEWIGAERKAVDNAFLEANNQALKSKAALRNQPETYVFSGSKLKHLIGGASEAERGVILPKDQRPTTINRLSGHIVALYSHDAVAPTNIQGGEIRIKSADFGSELTLRTDAAGLKPTSRKGTEINRKNETLNALAGKLIYEGAATEKHLNGRVEIAEGLTSTAKALAAGAINFQPDGRGKFDYRLLDTDSELTFDNQETAIIANTKSQIMAGVLQWRASMNDLQKRLGDLRDGDAAGLWARIYGGRISYRKSNADMKDTFHAVQIGADQRLQNGWHVGGAFAYNDGNVSGRYGSNGDTRLYTLGMYATKMSASGEYLDVIAKAGRIRNDFSAYNAYFDAFRKYVRGKYSSSVYGISVEYGKRMSSGHTYWIPQAELAWSHINGDTFSAHTSGGETMQVNQASVNSLIGRVGILAGIQGKKGNVYLRTSLLHEMDAKSHAVYEAEDRVESHWDLHDTWAEISLGASYDMTERDHAYADFTKSVGGDYKVGWKFNLGFRHSF